MNMISVNDKLPQDRTYVLVKHNRQNFRDNDHPEGVRWAVVKFVRGLSLEDRARLDNSDERKRLWLNEDERSGNNLRPYLWQCFGASAFFGQEIECWTYLPV